MQVLIPGLFLGIIFALFSERLRSVLKKTLDAWPKAIFLAPAALSAFFCFILAYYGVLNLALILLMLGYTFAPTVCAFGKSRWFELAIVLMLWLPLEFAVGSQWIPKRIQGTVHTAAYGIAITLALALLLLFRGLKGMKYNLPRNVRDLAYPAIGFVIAAPVLIAIGRLLGFIPPFHLPAHVSATSVAGRFLLIFAATALPEEILFRALIQNWLMQRFGFNNRTLLVAAVIFGSAHLNNAPGPIPNWRYMIVATVAGIAFGKVFQETSSVCSSAALHALVNTVDHTFF